MDPIVQANFSGGMNLLMESFNIGATEYGLAYNVRNRKTTLDPILAPVEDTAIPVGKKQGIYAFDKYLLCFVGGSAYYKNIITDSGWTQVAGLAMSGIEEYIYVQAIPASRLNFERKLAAADQVIGTNLNQPVLTTSNTVLGTPACAVVQDGVSLPWLILPDGSAVLSQTYEQWTKSNRQYIPIMKQMAYNAGILFGISPDGKRILRSVSGRPGDFVVNVTIDGNKGGDANTTAYAVGFDVLTCIIPLPTGEILVASANTLNPLQLDYSKTIFAEPTFNDLKVLSAGVVNQFSFLNILSEDGYNDSLFVDFDGFRSFNAVATEQNEGRNTKFSLNMGEALVPKQSITASINFGNYSFFSVRTVYNDNNLVGVWDNKTHQWVCFDRPGIGSIKQFAVANQGLNPTLYAITVDDKLYKLLSATTTLPITVRLAAYTSGASKTQVSLNSLGWTLVGGTRSGILSATEYVNGYLSKTLVCPLKGLLTENNAFNFAGVNKQTWQTQMVLSWNNDAKLALVETQLEGQTNNIQQAARTNNGD